MSYLSDLEKALIKVSPEAYLRVKNLSERDIENALILASPQAYLEFRENRQKELKSKSIESTMNFK
jgi:hypothetical protein